jgi:hypothetical protein
MGLQTFIASKRVSISPDSRSISLFDEPTIDRPAHQAIDQSASFVDLKNLSQFCRSDAIAEL